MWRKRLLNSALWVAAFLGEPRLEAWFRGTKRFPEPARTILLGSICVVGLGVIVWLPVRRFGKKFSPFLWRKVKPRNAEVSEFNEVHSVCSDFYTRPDHVINPDSLKDFMGVNQNTVRLFEKEKQPVALSIIFAINREAVRRILAGDINSAQELNLRYAARRNPVGLYITNICGRSIIDQGMAHRMLIRDLTERLYRNHSIEYIFGRMANADGGRLMRKYQFKKVNDDLPDLQIWKLSRQSFLEQIHELEPVD